jgi:hypothetical protein
MTVRTLQAYHSLARSNHADLTVLPHVVPPITLAFRNPLPILIGALVFGTALLETDPGVS